MLKYRIGKLRVDEGEAKFTHILLGIDMLIIRAWPSLKIAGVGMNTKLSCSSLQSCSG